MANNLPVTWERIHIDDQVVDRVGVVVTHGPVSSVLPIVLAMNVLKDLYLPHLLTKFELSGWRVQGCGL